MMHPDDIEKLLMIARLFLLVGMILFGLRCIVAIYYLIENFAQAT